MTSDFRTRLYNFEIPPPSNAWDKIIPSLDESSYQEIVSSKLHDSQIAPPENVWQKIATALTDEQTIKKPVPFLRKIQPYYRYAAAALLVGIVTFSISLLMTKKNVASLSERPLTPIEKESSTVKGSNESLQKNEQVGEKTVTPLAEIKKSQASVTLRSRNNVQNIFRKKLLERLNQLQSPAVLQTNYSAEELQENASKLNHPAWSLSYDHSKAGEVNKYITLLRPDGYLIRMSKKFADMIGCIYNLPGDPDKECRDQLKRWREKVAKATVTPSPENFMDILTLMELLEEY